MTNQHYVMASCHGNASPSSTQVLLLQMLNSELGSVSLKPTVVILVESWGLRKDFKMNVDEFDVFKNNRVQKMPADNICFGLNNFECVHGVRVRNTLRYISNLAERHPEYRFIIRGDHRPMEHSIESYKFVGTFYHGWVPVVILD